MRKKRLSSVTFIILALTFIYTVGCKKHEVSQERPPASVDVFKSVKKNLPVVISCFGEITAKLDVTIVPQVSGKLIEVGFEDGDKVEKGQLLYKIDDRVYKAQYNQAVAQLAADQASLAMSESTLQRNEQLYKENLISKEEYDQLKTNVDALQASIKADKANIELYETYLDYCTITAPMDGILGENPVDAGNIVSTSTRLVNIRNLDDLFINFNISEKYFEEVKNAMDKSKLKILFALKEIPSVVSVAELDFIDNTIKSSTGTIFLKGSVKNKYSLLWPGQFVDIFLITGIDHDATLIPSIAVKYGQKGPYVYVINDKQEAELREVVLGNSLGDITAVESGVLPGESVVLSGQLMLYPGAKVSVKKTVSIDMIKPKLSDELKANYMSVLKDLGINDNAISTFMNSGQIDTDEQ